MGLQESQYAVVIGRKSGAELGYDHLGLRKDRANEAQVLFTTQHKLNALTSNLAERGRDAE